MNAANEHRMNAAKGRQGPNVTRKAEAARREREAKLAEALRRNLDRRKARRRGQADGQADGEPEQKD